VASTIGGLLVLLPVPILIGAAVWGLVFTLSRYVSLASIALGVSLPLSCWLLPLCTKLTFGQPEFWFAAAIAAFNVLDAPLQHRPPARRHRESLRQASLTLSQ
jgi:glycerol-3-phosphate acyltransferase PlsY